MSEDKWEYQWGKLDAIIKLELEKIPCSDIYPVVRHEWVNAYEPKNLAKHRVLKDPVVLQPYRICKHCFRRDNYNEKITNSSDSSD